MNPITHLLRRSAACAGVFLLASALTLFAAEPATKASDESAAEKPADWREQIQTLKAQSDYTEASELLADVLKREPDNFEAHCETAIIAALAGDEEESLVGLQKIRPADTATDAAASHVWGRAVSNSLGSFLVLKARLDIAAQASAALRQAVKLSPKSAEYWLTLLNHLDFCQPAAVPATASLALRQLGTDAAFRAKIDSLPAVQRERYEADPVTNAAMAEIANREVIWSLNRGGLALVETSVHVGYFGAAGTSGVPPVKFSTAAKPTPPPPPAEAAALLAALPPLEQDTDLPARVTKISAALAKHRPYLDAYIARARVSERLADGLAGWVELSAPKSTEAAAAAPAAATPSAAAMAVAVDQRLKAAIADYTRALELAPDRLDLQLARAQLADVYDPALAMPCYAAALTLAKDPDLRAELAERTGDEDSQPDTIPAAAATAALRSRWLALRSLPPRRAILLDLAYACKRWPDATAAAKITPADPAKAEAERSAAKDSFIAQAEVALTSERYASKDADRFIKAWRLAARSLATVPTARGFRALAFASYGMGAPDASHAYAKQETARAEKAGEEAKFSGSSEIYKAPAAFMAAAVALDPADKLAAGWQDFFQIIAEEAEDVTLRFEEVMLGTSLAYGFHNPSQFFSRLSDEQALADQKKNNVAAHPLTLLWLASLADTFHGKHYAAKRLEADIVAGRSHDVLKLVALVNELEKLDAYEGDPKPYEWRKYLDKMFASELADDAAAKAVARIRQLTEAGNREFDSESYKLINTAKDLDPKCTRLALARALERQRLSDEAGMLTVIREALANRPEPAAAAELYDLRAPVHLRNNALNAWLVDRATAATLRGEDVAVAEKDWISRTGGATKDTESRLFVALLDEYKLREEAKDSPASAVITERMIVNVGRGKQLTTGGTTDEHMRRLAAVDWAQAGQYDRALAALDLVLKRTSDPQLTKDAIENLAYTRVQLAMRAAEKYSRHGLPYAEDLRLARELDTTIQTAVAACDRAEKSGNAGAWVHGQRGYLFNAVGRYAEAGAAFRRAFELDPKNGSYPQDLGLALIYDQQYREAREVYQQCLKTLPPDSPSRGSVDKNLKHIAEVLAKHPDLDPDGDFQPQPFDLTGPAGERLKGVRLTLGVGDGGIDWFCPDVYTADLSILALIRKKGAIQKHTLDEQKLHLTAAYLNGRQIGEAVPKISSLSLSADGRRLAFEATFLDGTSAVVVDGQCGPRQQGSISLGKGNGGFSPDGKHLAYKVSSGEGDTYRQTVIVDGKPGPELTSIGDLSWRGQEVVYLAEEPGGKPVLVEGSRVTPRTRARRAHIQSQDGKRVAHVEDTGQDQARVIVDGQPQGDYGAVEDLLFSSDSKHVIWKAETNGLWRLYLDGRDSGFAASKSDSDHRIVFSADGAHWIAHGAFDPVKKSRPALLDGQALELKVGEKGWVNALSPDGTRWAAMDERDKKMVVIVDGKEVGTSEPADSIYDMSGQFFRTVFSPDSKHVAWVERPEAKTAAVVIDGERGPDYTKIRTSSLTYCGGRVVYLAERTKGSSTEYFFCVDFGGYTHPTVSISDDKPHVEIAPGVIRFLGSYTVGKFSLLDALLLKTRIRIDIDVTKAPQIPSPAAELLAAEKAKKAQQEVKDRQAIAAAKIAEEEKISRDPQARATADAALALARAAAKKNDIVAVEKHVQEAFAATPRYAPALVMRATLKAAKKDAAGARADLDTAVAVDRQSALALGSRALLRLQTGDQAGAEKDADAAIALDPTAKEGRFTRAQLRSAKRDIGGAIAEIDALLQGAEKPVEAYVFRAQLLAAAGKRDLAVKDVQAAAATDPDNAQLHIGAADLLLKLGDLEAARAQLQAAEKLGDTRATKFLAQPPFTAAPPKPTAK